MTPQPYRDNFNTLHRAFADGAAGLLGRTDRATGKPAFVICAVNRRDPDCEPVPAARLFDGDPYELPTPPKDADKEGRSV